jgi:hypothetical protein
LTAAVLVTATRILKRTDCPAVIVERAARFVSRSRAASVSDLAVALLLVEVASLVADEILAVLARLERRTAPPPTRMAKVKLAVAPAGSDAIVHRIVPRRLAAGVVQANGGPLAWVAETKVVPVASASVSTTDCASDGPLLVAVTV